MKLIWLDHTVPPCLALGLASAAVEVDLAGHQRLQAHEPGVVEPVVGLLGAPAAACPDELNDGVGEGQLDACLGAGHALDEGERLGDELLEVEGRELVTLGHVQEDLSAVHSSLQVAGHQLSAAVALDHDNVGARHHDAVLQLVEVDDQLSTAEHDGHQGQRVPRCEREIKWEGDVESTGLLRVRNQLLSAVRLPDHLRQPLARLARQLLPDVQEVVAQLVNGLGADDEGGLPHQQEPNGVGPVAPRVLVAGGARAPGARIGRAVAHVVSAGPVVLEQPGGSPTVQGRKELGVGDGAGVVGVLGVRELLGGPAGAGPGRAGADARDLQHHIQEVQQVTRLVNLAAGGFTKGHL